MKKVLLGTVGSIILLFVTSANVNAESTTLVTLPELADTTVLSELSDDLVILDQTQDLEYGTVQTASGAILTRYWTTGWTKSGNPAPQVALFNGGNGYRGYLSKYKELSERYGTKGFYQGYFYHYSLPLPMPSYRAQNSIVSE